MDYYFYDQYCGNCHTRNCEQCPADNKTEKKRKKGQAAFYMQKEHIPAGSPEHSAIG